MKQRRVNTFRLIISSSLFADISLLRYVTRRHAFSMPHY